MRHSNTQNHVILEGAWGLGKTPVAREFSRMFHYQFVPEPSHLTDTAYGSARDLQTWYRRAHTARETYLADASPCILERSILSVYAFEYARSGRLPLAEETAHIKQVLEVSKTILVVLSPDPASYETASRMPHVIESVRVLLAERRCMERYFEFYTQVLPWDFGIVPLLLPPMDPARNRGTSTIASEIWEAIHGQRVAQVNVVCGDANTPPEHPRILLLKRAPARGGFWQTITGGIHPGELLPSAALRETEEEAGISLSSQEMLPTHFAHSFPGGTGYQLTEYVFATWVRQSQHVHRSEEHDDMRWVFPEEAKKLMKYESNRLSLDHAVEAMRKRPIQTTG